MKRLLPWVAVMIALMLLAGCAGSAGRKSMFPPTLSIQQMHVQPDGHWHVQLRILNNSYGSMQFRELDLDFLVDQQPADHIDKSLKLDIAPHSADVVEINVTPSSAARKALATIADKGSAGTLGYAFQGTASAIPEHAKKARRFDVDSHDWLSAIPGVADTYR